VIKMQIIYYQILLVECKLQFRECPSTYPTLRKSPAYGAPTDHS